LRNCIFAFDLNSARRRLILRFVEITIHIVCVVDVSVFLFLQIRTMDCIQMILLLCFIFL